MTEDSPIPSKMAAYFEQRRRERARDVEVTYAAMNPRERRLVREAAVMGYVRGAMAGETHVTLREPGRSRRTPIPKDSDIVREVIDATFAFPDLYPVMNRMKATAHRREARDAV